MRVSVQGGGSWGTAFAALLTWAGHEVTVWARRPEIAEQINAGVNERYLPDASLPDGLTASSSPAACLAGAELVVLAIPSQSLRANLTDWGAHLPQQAPLVSLAKGIELRTTLRMSQVIARTLACDPQRICVLSGPNLAREIIAGQPAASVVACQDERTAAQVAEVCAGPTFRPYTSTDVVGVELGGSVKNVIALAVGMAQGLGLGDNSKASLITRGLAEMTRLGVALGAQAPTFSGLAGVGDLIATCMSPLSRNHSFGVGLGEGKSVQQLERELHSTTEGVKSCQPILELGRAHGVDLPITEQVVALVHENKSARDVGHDLLARSLKSEIN